MTTGWRAALARLRTQFQITHDMESTRAAQNVPTLDNNIETPFWGQQLTVTLAAFILG